RAGQPPRATRSVLARGDGRLGSLGDLLGAGGPPDQPHPVEDGERRHGAESDAVKAKPPTSQCRSAMAITRATPAVIWLRGREKSTRPSIHMRKPTIAISPQSTKVTPPSTPGVIVLITAPTFGDIASAIATSPATQ